MKSNNFCRGHTLRTGVGIITLSIILLAGSVEAATLTVNASSGADYSRIQDAINNASPSDTILVFGGTYFENVNVNKRLVLKGVDTGWGKPVVIAQENGSAIIISAGNSTLEGFTVINGSSYRQTGILVTSNNNILRNNNASNNNYGIYLSYSSSNTLCNNNASNNSYGIKLYSSRSSTLCNNNVSNNKNHGIYLAGSSNNNMLVNNNVSNNFHGILVEETYTRYNRILSNNISNNKKCGIFFDFSSENELSNNFFNNFCNIGMTFYRRMPASHNYFNITRTREVNIIGGPYLGGNFWSNPEGKGFSQICPDSDKDGICDSPYKLLELDNEFGSPDVIFNIDYLPLTYGASVHNFTTNLSSLAVLSVTPESSIIDMIGVTRTFNIKVNQSVNFSWYINETEVFNITNVNQSFYANTRATSGTWNVTVTAWNANGTASYGWNWTVIEKLPLHGNGSISGYKINDLNSNGKKDTNEPELAGWDMKLENSTGSVSYAITNASGFYIFTGLAPDNYTVSEVPVPGWIRTFPAAPGIYNRTLTDGENITGMDFVNNFMPLPSGVNATREIEIESHPGNSTNITVRISSNMIQALALQEIIPMGWNLTRISDDADGFKDSTNEWIWSNATPGITETVIYKITAPASASIGAYYISGTISNSSGVITIVGGDKIITHDIFTYYRRLGSDPDRVETRDLLKAMDDYRSGTVPAGFARPIRSQELLVLINEWANGGVT